MTQPATKNLIDTAEIRRALSILVEPGQVFEVRALEATTKAESRYINTLGGYFDNASDLIKHLTTIQSALGVYITLQACHQDLLDRAYNKIIKQKKDYSTPDKYITSYRWLLIDGDPERVSLISSTDEEHEQALAHSRHTREELRAQGWPEPIVADSGNGGHLLYRIDLAATDSDLVKRVLEGLAGKFDIPGLHIDKSVFNPARICKLYGTLACKGDDTSRRPHRMSRIIEIPASLQVVSRELLEAIAVPTQIASPTYPPSATVQTQGRFDIEGWMSQHDIEHYGPEPYEGGTRYTLKKCAWDASHTRGAVIIQLASGAISASCRHDSCTGKKWQDFRTIYEPDAYTHKKKQGTQEKKPSPATTAISSNGHMPQRDGSASVVTTLDKELCEFTPDDAGNGDALFALFGPEFLWCPSRGWFRHTGKYWDLDPDSSEVKKRAVETLRARRIAAVKMGKEAIVKCTKGDESRVNGCVSRFKTLVSVSIDTFDNNPDVLNCQNGVVDLRTGNVEPHDRDQRFTYCLPVEYEPSDYSEWTEYLQEAAGYSLTGHTREEILFYLFGPTRSGKGTWAETFMFLLPAPLSTMVDFNSFTAKREGDVSNFDLAPLKPARMIFASESNRSQSLNPAKIKQLTGGDRIRACFKHKDFFEYRPQFKVWMLSNHPVNGDPEDDALWGRVRVIEFPTSFLGREDPRDTQRDSSKQAEKMRSTFL